MMTLKSIVKTQVKPEKDFFLLKILRKTILAFKKHLFNFPAFKKVAKLGKN